MLAFGKSKRREVNDEQGNYGYFQWLCVCISGSVLGCILFAVMTPVIIAHEIDD
jgi:hypothetical protein